jgi:hypothetical protein
LAGQLLRTAVDLVVRHELHDARVAAHLFVEDFQTGPVQRAQLQLARRGGRMPGLHQVLDDRR